MRKELTIWLLLMSCILLGACHQDEDTLFTSASISLVTDKDIVIQRVQGTITLTNLNTKQVTTSAEFDGNVAHVQVLRGSYAVLVEGSLQYQNAQGVTSAKQFRASSDYIGLYEENDNIANLNIVWLE